jgi:DNA helicase-2/ATP-dependent DNA helicase PcrA
MSEIHDLILHDLNPAQREAVTAPDGPLLVFAGAGSGKTRVLTRRLAYLLVERDVQPSEILAVTFTNKAADEMRRRVEALLGRHTHGMWIHTFHSACVRILRSHADRVGRRGGFSIYDETDQQTLIRELAALCDIDTKEWAPRQIAHWFDLAKNDAIDPVDYAAHVPAPIRAKYVELARLYARRVREANAFDFGDLIVETIRLLGEHPEIRDGYRQRFRHILVDEFQDTNQAQYILLRLLLGEHHNLTVVGDDDQSIYRWRGARVDNILQFEKQFAGARVVVLGANYRSSARILQAAGAVIQHNQGRKPKELTTPNAPGTAVVRCVTDDEFDEARFAAATIHDLRLRHGLRPRDIAVFYRINAQSRLVEEKLLERGLPYVVVGGTRFYDRKEIKDALAYLRLYVNPADEVAFERVINVPPRGVGDTTLGRLRELAGQENSTLPAACARVAAGAGEHFSAKVRQELGRFARLLLRPAGELLRERPSPLAARLLEESRYLSVLRESKKIEDRSRLENLQELLKSIEEFEAEAGDEATIELFLEKVSLLSDPDLYDERADAVSLMTLHTAKGLEFPAVVMLGLEEGLLPHSRSLEDRAELEEERRLCYVGITRAKKWLVWTAAAFRRSFGGVPTPTRLSRFWTDLPPEVVEDIGPVSAFRRPTRQPSLLGVPKAPAPGETSYDYSESQDPDDPRAHFVAGSLVKHPHFGLGRVKELSGKGTLARATVVFERFGEKTLVLKYAGLKAVAKR